MPKTVETSHNCPKRWTINTTLVDVKSVRIYFSANPTLPGVIRPRLSPRDATRAWKTLGNRDAGGGLIFAFDLSQFFAQSCRFLAILCRFHMVLDGRDAADRIHKLANSIVLAVLAFAHVFEAVCKIVLVLCVAL